VWLEEYVDATVGTLGVEHRKRLAITVELVVKPTLLFSDEPTSDWTLKRLGHSVPPQDF
jgi:ABC-type multidrug transport system ATPase subunit